MKLELRSTIAFAALVGFALVNTAFLGYYLYSGSGLVGGTSTGSAAVESLTVTATSTAATVANTAPSSTVTESGTITATTTVTSGVQSGALAVLSSNVTSSTTQTSVTSLTGQLSSSQAALGVSVANVSSAAPASAIVKFFEDHSLLLAPGSWVAVGGMWIWRGRMRSKWTDLGFDSDVFTLFVKMKGAKTRIRLLDALSVPKDRLQLAEELGLDWKSVDRHVAVMKKYGFLDDKVAYGRVKMYQLTPVGVSLLKLLQELSKEEKRADDSPTPLLEGEA